MKIKFLLLGIWMVAGLLEICYSQPLPITPVRTISFTTDQGTAMDVDISRDGKTLLFTLLGDIYTIPTVGGKAHQITQGMALNFRPVWSPDGRRIAYISDFSGALHVNVRNLPGTFHQVLGRSEEQIDTYDNSAPIWSPDGNYVSIGESLYAITGVKIPGQKNRGRLMGVSPVGQSFYLDADTLYRYDGKLNTQSQVALNLENFQNGQLSPSGQWWAYVADSASKKCLILRDLINNTKRILVPSLLSKYPLFKAFTQPHFSFSADNRNIFIGYGGNIHKINVESGFDQIIPFTADVKVDAGAFDYNAFSVPLDTMRIKYTRSANGSPDGKHLVFSAIDRLYVMDLPDGKARVLAFQPFGQFQPAWSPDGKWIAYVSWCDTVGGFLWRVPSSGGRPEQLTPEPAQYQRPVWSPDGSHLAIIKGPCQLGDWFDAGHGQLELVPVDDGPIRVVADTVPLWNRLSFSPDGGRIMYKPKSGYNDGVEFHPELVSRDLATKDQRVLAVARTTALPGFIQQPVVSPDGRYIAYSMAENLYLVPISPFADPTVIYDQKGKTVAIRFASGMDPFWENGGKVLSWSYGSQFYRIDPDKILAMAQKDVSDSPGNYMIANVKPDQLVTLPVSVARQYAHGIIALTNVRIITMQGGKVIENGTIVIWNGRITTVGPSQEIHVPKLAKIFNLSGATVMPGLVDLHLHMHLSSDIFPQQSWMYLANLAYGVTTARDPSSSYDSYGYSELIESGQMLGPRLYSVGRAVRLYSEGIDKVNNLEDARSIVLKRAIFGVTVIKQYALPTRSQREWLLKASREFGLNMTNEGDFNPIFDLAMIKDGSTGIEHNPDWGDVYDDLTTLFAKSGTYLTPTLQVRGPKDAVNYFNYKYWRLPGSKLERFTPEPDLKYIASAAASDTINVDYLYATRIDALLRKQGGRVTLGSHGENQGIGAHNELWALKEGGLSNIEALQAATIMGAEAIGIQKDVGSLEVGKIADLIILDKNPLEDIHNSKAIRYVMKNGILYDGGTLDEIWPLAMKCPQWRMK